MNIKAALKFDIDKAAEIEDTRFWKGTVTA